MADRKCMGYFCRSLGQKVPVSRSVDPWSARTRKSSVLFDLMFLDQTSERPPFLIGCPGRASHVAIMLSKQIHDVITFKLLDGLRLHLLERVAAAGRRICLEDRKMFGLNRFRFGEHDDLLDNILQFANVPGPRISAQQFDGSRRKPQLAPTVFPSIDPQEMRRQ